MEKKQNINRREFLEAAILTAAGTVLAACGDADKLTERALQAAGGLRATGEAVKETVKNNLCQGIGSGDNLACQPGNNPLEPPSVQDAIQNLQNAYQADLFIDPGAIEGARETAAWWSKWGTLALQFTQSRTTEEGKIQEPISYYDLSSGTTKDQWQSFYDLFDASVSDGRQTVLEVGPGMAPSPFLASQGSERRTVFAIDNQNKPASALFDDRLPQFQNELQPVSKKTSFAAFFGLNYYEIGVGPNKLNGRRFNIVQIIGFDTIRTAEVINHACDIGKFIVFVPEQGVIADEFLLHSYTGAYDAIECSNKEMRSMTLNQIKQLLGTSYSSYIDPETLGDQRLPVIIAEP